MTSLFASRMWISHTALEATKGTNIGVGAENCHWEVSGALHRRNFRKYAHRNGRKIRYHRPQRAPHLFWRDGRHRQQARRALHWTAGLTVILCVGEYLEQREQGITAELVAMQTKIALQGVTQGRALPRDHRL